MNRWRAQRRSTRGEKLTFRELEYDKEFTIGLNIKPQELRCIFCVKMKTKGEQ